MRLGFGLEKPGGEGRKAWCRAEQGSIPIPISIPTPIPTTIGMICHHCLDAKPEGPRPFGQS
ncbi:MAG TPA: hypothetical protein DEW46_17315 [Verrucomicrobia bacterium]|jgi:hypothetical protein|nr:hypothetical protein [Verrucomicrobiota bacterium]